MWVFAKDLLDPLLHGRHTGHTTDEDNLIDLAGRQPGILKSREAWSIKSFEQIRAQRLELCPRELHR